MGTPAIVQFCDQSGAIEAQLYVHYDGGKVGEWIPLLAKEFRLRNHRRNPRNASAFAAAFIAWRYDRAKFRFSLNLFDALEYTPRPVSDNHNCYAAHTWRVTVRQDGEPPIVEEVDDERSRTILAGAGWKAGRGS